MVCPVPLLNCCEDACDGIFEQGQMTCSCIVLWPAAVSTFLASLHAEHQPEAAPAQTGRSHQATYPNTIRVG